jgi:ADP-heptose:LPS heptosyltransferase
VKGIAAEDYQGGQSAALVLIGNIGDVLLLEPCLRFLHERGLILDLFCTAETAMVWQGDTRLRTIIPIRSSNQKYQSREDAGAVERAERASGRYDYLFDFWPTGRSVKLAWRIRARQKVTWTGLGAKRLLRAAVYDWREDFPGLDILRAKVYLRLLGLSADEAEHWLPARIEVEARALEHFWARFPQANPTQKSFLVLQPTARWQRKLWPVSEWRGLVQRLAETGKQVRMVSGPVDEERKFLSAIAEGLVPNEHLFAGTLSWGELKCLLASGSGFVGLDSAPYHLAAMLGKPLVVLFGPTNEKEWGPILPKQIVVKAQDTPPTMAGIKAQEVWRACGEAFGQ